MWNVYIAGGTNNYLSKIYKLNFPKLMCFSATQPPKIHFSMKGNEVYSPEKKNIPGDPGKTKPVKCIKPPPQNKRPWGGLDIPTHGSYI